MGSGIGWYTVLVGIVESVMVAGAVIEWLWVLNGGYGSGLGATNALR